MRLYSPKEEEEKKRVGGGRVGGGEEMMYQEQEVSVEGCERELSGGEILQGESRLGQMFLRRFTVLAVTFALGGAKIEIM